MPAKRALGVAPTFRLFDLRVEVEQAKGRPMICNHKIGDSFELSGENLSLPPGQTFPLYSLAAILPLLPAKQRDTHPHDWMTTDALIACPDPNCGGRFRIRRTGTRVFKHADVTAVPQSLVHESADRKNVRFELAPGYSISRIIKGGWQLAEGHGATPSAAQARADMAAFVDAGITTFDCADIYTGVEELIGSFIPPDRRSFEAHTKYVPDLALLETIDAASIRAIVDRSRARLRRPALDLVQFHWWDYGVERYVEVALGLDALRREGAIRHIGVTNFDTARLRSLLDGGVPVVSHQVQYSLLDRRPAGAMSALAAERGFAFLCYGSVLGGFLSERWLGAPEPREPLENRSLTKYKLVIDEAVGWDAFQSLLSRVREIARKHDATIGAIGIAWVLAQPHVAAAIVGSRNANHLQETLNALEVRLDPNDLATLNGLSGRGIPGDVYEIERDRTGPHGRVMKYDLGARTGSGTSPGRR